MDLWPAIVQFMYICKEAARTMMDGVGEGALVIDGRMLSFEYRTSCFQVCSSCFQCNESRTDDASSADMATSNSTSLGNKGFEAGPTHVLAVRGLDENADEEMLRYEFAKHAPVKFCGGHGRFIVEEGGC